MIQAIRPISIAQSGDPEYQRILAELKKLGLTPSGNKSIDKGRLESAKQELVQKIQEKENFNQQQQLQVQPLNAVESTDNSKKAEMEQQRLGAMNVAELNKIYFGL